MQIPILVFSPARFCLYAKQDLPDLAAHRNAMLLQETASDRLCQDLQGLFDKHGLLGNRPTGLFASPNLQ